MESVLSRCVLAAVLSGSPLPVRGRGAGDTILAITPPCGGQVHGTCWSVGEVGAPRASGPQRPPAREPRTRGQSPAGPGHDLGVVSCPPGWWSYVGLLLPLTLALADHARLTTWGQGNESYTVN